MKNPPNVPKDRRMIITPVDGRVPQPGDRFMEGDQASGFTEYVVREIVAQVNDEQWDVWAAPTR